MTTHKEGRVHPANDPARLIAQLRAIEAAPGDLWGRTIAAKARDEIERLTTILDWTRDRLYMMVLERAGPRPVPIERLTALVEERLGSALSEGTRVPPGWKLVPVRATKEMLYAGSRHEDTASVYRAMLNAAPIYKGHHE